MEAMREDERGREEQGMRCVMMVMVMVMVSLFPVQSSPVQSGLSVWLSSSTARLNQYFLLASYLTLPYSYMYVLGVPQVTSERKQVDQCNRSYRPPASLLLYPV